MQAGGNDAPSDMKLSLRAFGCLLGIAFYLGGCLAGRAQTATWNYTGAGSWTETSRWTWSGGSAPASALPEATTNFALSNGGTIQLRDSSQAVLALTMNNGRLEITKDVTGGILRANAAVVLGSAVNSNSTLLIDGLGSEFLKSDATQIHVGSAGNATLTISNQGKMTATSTIHVGLGSATGTTGTGVLNVNTQGQLVTTSTFILGYRGNGSMNIESGGYVKSPNGFIAGYGQDANRVQGTASVKVSGTGSKWDVGAVYVGHTGTGTLLIEDGGVVNSTSSGTIGFYNAGVSSSTPGQPAAPTKYGTGTMTVTGGGMWQSTLGLSVGTAGSTGTLNVSGQGKVNVGGGTGILSIGTGGVLNIGGNPVVDVSPLAPGIISAGTITASETGGRLLNLFHNDHSGLFALTKTGVAGGGHVAITGGMRLNVLSGTTLLQGANTFTGGTIIGGSAGNTARLVINHVTALGTGTVRIKDGGTLEVAATQASILIQNNVTLENGSGLAFSVDLSGGEWSPRMELTGSLSFMTNPGDKIKIYLTGGGAVTNPALYDWTFLRANSGIWGDTTDLFEVISDVPGFYVFQRDDTLVLGMSVVPEPGRLALCMSGIGSLGLRRRRR